MKIRRTSWGVRVAMHSRPLEFWLCVTVVAVSLLPDSAAVVNGGEQADPIDRRCGAYCLYVGMGALDIDLPEFERFEAMLGTAEPAGYSMQQLVDCARQFGCETLGVRTTCENLADRSGRFACIALTGGRHYVLLTDLRENEATIVDPPREFTTSRAALLNQWNGECLLVSRESLLPEETIAGQSRFLALARRTGIGLAIVGGILLAILLLRRFRRRAIAGAIAVTSFCMLVGCGPDTGTLTTESDVPELFIPDLYRDAGAVVADDDESHEFRYELVNRGKAPLTIETLERSCSCAQCRLSRSVIPPGESAELLVTVSANGLGTERGATVTIVSNDPQANRVQVIATWKPALHVSFDPARIDFGEVVMGSAISADATVLRRGSAPTGEMSVRAIPQDLLHAELSENGAGHVLRVSLQPSMKIRDGEVVIESSGREYRLPVSWRSNERISAEPAALMLDAGEPGARRRAVFRVRSLAPGLLNIESARASDGSANLALNRLSDTEYEGAVDVVLPSAPGVFRTSMAIICDSPEKRELLIPITAIVDESEKH